MNSMDYEFEFLNEVKRLNDNIEKVLALISEKL